MTLQELLTKHGLTEEAVVAFLADMKENKIFTASEENLDLRYGKLKGEHETKVKELEEANRLLEEVKKSTKGNDELQQKLSVYETETIPNLQKELEETKIKSALKVALLGEKAVDVGYLTYKIEEKLRENGETLTLDENENIKGIEDRIASLKTQFPTMFESSSSTKKIDPIKLPDSGGENKLTKADLFKMPYAERAKFQSENPTEYQTIMKS